VHVREAPGVYEVAYDQDLTVYATGEHPFNIDDDWKVVKELRPGMQQHTTGSLLERERRERGAVVYLASNAAHARIESKLFATRGPPARIKSIRYIPGRVTVYNISVDRAHAYFVGNEKVAVHVHNAPPEQYNQTVFTERQKELLGRFGTLNAAEKLELVQGIGIKDKELLATLEKNAQIEEQSGWDRARETVKGAFFGGLSKIGSVLDIFDTFSRPLEKPRAQSIEERIANAGKDGIVDESNYELGKQLGGVFGDAGLMYLGQKLSGGKTATAPSSQAQAAKVVEGQRIATAMKYYESTGYRWSVAKDHLNGIDFTKEVSVKTIPKGTVVYQYVGPNGQGNYYTSARSATPNQLGVSGAGRELKSFRVTKNVEVLSSRSKAIEDTWSGSTAVKTEGGAPQYFSTEKSAFKEIKGPK
jgi:Bacterial toxin 46